jgi:hypothetical protein
MSSLPCDLELGRRLWRLKAALSVAGSLHSKSRAQFARASDTYTAHRLLSIDAADALESPRVDHLNVSGPAVRDRNSPICEFFQNPQVFFPEKSAPCAL